MTYRDDPPRDDTDVVERERIVEPERPVADPVPVVPVAAAPVAVPVPSNQVNVNDGGRRVVGAPGPLYYARRVIVLLFGILFVLLALRIILLLLGANSDNGIVDGIYNVTEPFVAPFRGIFNFDLVRPSVNHVLDVAALVSLVGWILIELLILAVLRLGDRDTVAS